MWGSWFGTIFGPVGAVMLVGLLALGTGVFGNPIIGIAIAVLLMPFFILRLVRSQRESAEAATERSAVEGAGARLGPSHEDFDRGVYGEKRA